MKSIFESETNKMNNQQITGHVTPETLEQLESLAAAKKVSKSELIRNAVNFLLDMENYKNNDMYFMLVHKQDTHEKVLNRFENLKENVALDQRISRNY